MSLPHINERSLVRLTIGLGDNKGVDDFDPPLTEAERQWYFNMKAEDEEFARKYPGKTIIWEIPFDYD